ncbi:uncharacterized protein LOC119080979 [Bradysia coprophila]|uniref:uncharacterized protein LOC119080979 n=1 Tax=Bradysia coprophila TaxID=38358 RepID=UPI00187DC160|nr:uncharacterized protein LOC119080979 [Bradysia coprophila]
MLFKITIFTLAFVAGIFAEATPEAKPAIVAPLAYTSPVVVDAPVVTATSSQFIARNYNGVAAPVAYTAYSPYAYAPYAYAVNPVAPLKYRTVVSAPVKYTAATVLV